MAFTKVDLTRWEKRAKREKWIYERSDRQLALIKRLEAAEAVIKNHRIADADICPELEAWRRACGKDVGNE